MIDLDLRAAPLSLPRGASDLDESGRSGSAAVCISVYLGIVVGFGALMGHLVRVVGG